MPQHEKKPASAERATSIPFISPDVVLPSRFRRAPDELPAAPSFQAKYIESGVAVLRAMNASSGLKEMLAGLLYLAADSSSSKVGGIWVMDNRAKLLRAAITINLPDEYLPGAAVVPLGTGTCGRCAASLKPEIVEDTFTDPLFADYREASVASGIRACFSVPIISSEGKCLGSLGNHFMEKFSPSKAHIERNQTYAQLMAFAVQHFGVPES